MKHSRRSFVVGAAALACGRRPVPPIPPLGPAFEPHAESDEPVVRPPDPVIPFGMYSVPSERMGQLAEAGFTLAGPFYPRELELNPGRLDVAREHGLGVLVPVGPHRTADTGDPLAASREALRDEVARGVEAHADDEAVAAWYLLPEELDADVDSDLGYLELAAATIREVDPHARPILAYQPNMRPVDRLRKVARHLDWVAKGAYVNYAGYRDARAWVRSSVGDLDAATRPGQLPFAVVEMFQDPPDASSREIVDWARHDVLLALLSGARGVLVFSGWPRPQFDRYDDYFAAYAEVVGALRRPGVARAALEGEPLDLALLRGPAHAEIVIRDRPVRHRSLSARRAGPVTIVVNSAPTEVTCRLPGPPATPEAGVATWAPRSHELTLPPFGSAVLRDDDPSQR